jgi:hypothetical protein
MVTNFWFVGWGDKQPMGPLSEKDLIQMLQDNDLNWGHFVCNPAMDCPWTRAIDIEFLKPYWPHAPSLMLYSEVTKSTKSQYSYAKSLIEKDSWLFQFNGSQFGPLVPDELKLILKKFTLKTPMYAWRPGLKGWVLASEIPELAHLSDQVQTKIEKTKKNARKTQRSALLATIMIGIEGRSTFVGVCRDISQGGVFVTTNEAVMPETPVEIKVEPVTECGITKFKAEGRVVDSQRHDEGLAIAFTKINPKTSAEIGAYVKIHSKEDTP